MTKAKKARKKSFYWPMMSNSPTNSAYQRLELFYKGAAENTIGWMDALNTDTGNVEPLLVGIDIDPETGETQTFPIARIFGSYDESKGYLAPDGKGGWISGHVKEG
jgi:hypothetical protein